MLNNPVWAATASYSDGWAPPGPGGQGRGLRRRAPQGPARRSVVRLSNHWAKTRKIAASARPRGNSRLDPVAPEWSTAPNHAAIWLDIPIRFPAPGAADARTVSKPYWVAGFDPGQALKVFPKEAADMGVTTGPGVAECLVAADGSLNHCAPKEADPQGLGFPEAAAVPASTREDEPRGLRSGEPVDGTVVRLGVRLNPSLRATLPGSRFGAGDERL